MAVKKTGVQEFLELAKSFPVLDVRSPSEYIHAHIPGAISFPLFSDEERKVVGTTYKQNSREAAIKIGLDLFGPKMRPMVERVEALTETQLNSSEKPATRTVLVHCWRGGMRSGAVAWLLDLYGFNVYTLVGGYKKFRNWVIETYSQQRELKILGGFTGSGKTYVLQELKKMGQKAIDLEGIACHKGSAFGHIGQPPQPTQEMFENLLSVQLQQLSYDEYPIWMEDESQRIGHLNIPNQFWMYMRTSKVTFLDIPFEERLQHLVKEYGELDAERLAHAIERIQKRLGPLETKTSLQLLKDGDFYGCFAILLKYYDKGYLKGLMNRENHSSMVQKIPFAKVNHSENAQALIEGLSSL
jgi:tRNA 2-selenouridine synthase